MSFLGGTIELMEDNVNKTFGSIEAAEAKLIALLKKLPLNENFDNRSFYQWIKNFDVKKQLKKLDMLPEKIIQELGKLLTWIVDLVKRFFEMLISGMKKGKLMISEMFASLVEAFEKLADIVKNKISNINIEKLPVKIRVGIENLIEQCTELALKFAGKVSAVVTKIETVVVRMVKNPALIKRFSEIATSVKNTFASVTEFFIKVKNAAAPGVGKFFARTTKFLGKFAVLIDIAYKGIKAFWFIFDKNVDFDDVNKDSFWYSLAAFLVAIIIAILAVLLAKIGFVVAAAALGVSLLVLAGYEVASGVDLLALAAAPYLKGFWDNTVMRAWRSIEEFFAEAERGITNLLLSGVPFPRP